MIGKRYLPINDISQCVVRAQALAKGLTDRRCKDRELANVFTSLAGDEHVGILAYAIWRDRSRRLSRLRLDRPFRYDWATRVRHAQP